MPDPTLFHGIAVLIDDEINDANASVRVIQKQIEEAGCYVVSMSSLPTDASVPNLREVAFFVLDWNLYGKSLKEIAGEGEVLVPRGMKQANAASNIKFLKDLMKVRFAPVFIFTDGPVEEITDQLKKDKDLYDEADPSHILVMTKGDVTEKGVFNVLARWMEEAPSVYVLKKWERAYEKAKNELFVDFYAKSVQWPLVLWKTYQDDNVSASVELGNVIGRNLLSRMTPFHFDLGPFEGALQTLEGDEGKSRATVLKVLEGERFLPKNRLQGDSVAPGDVFKRGGDFYINIRPDCDCIARDGITQDQVKLYLLKGSKITNAKVVERCSSKYGTIYESDTESAIFGMTAAATVSFQFGTLIIEESGGWMADRIGRLLPPFLTRLQQRYSAYLQRPGLSRIPKAALPPLPPPVTAPPASAASPSATAVKKTASRGRASAKSSANKSPKGGRDRPSRGGSSKRKSKSPGKGS